MNSIMRCPINSLTINLIRYIRSNSPSKMRMVNVISGLVVVERIFLQ